MASQTRAKIKQAFLELAEKRSIDKITVTDIVNRCQINRNSFYYYFEDLPSLAETVAKEVFEDEVLTANPRTIQDCVLLMGDLLLENRSICLHIYNSKSRSTMERYYCRVFYTVTKEFLESVDYYDLGMSETEKEGLHKYFATLLIGLMTDWLTASMNYDIKREFAMMMNSRKLINPILV